MPMRPPGQDYRLLPVALSVLAGAALSLHADWTDRAGALAAASPLLIPLLAGMGFARARARSAAVGSARCEPEAGNGPGPDAAAGRPRRGAAHARRMGLACLAGLSVGWSVAWAHLQAAAPEGVRQAVASGGDVRLTAVVDEDPARAGTGCAGQVRPERMAAGRRDLPVGGHVRMLVWNMPCDARTGQRLEASGRIKPIASGRRAAGAVYARTTRIDGEPTMRARIVGRIDDALSGRLDGFPAHARGLVPGVALGRSDRLAAPLEAAMRLVQLTHLIAVSGGHVSILLAMVLGVVGRRARRTAAALSAASVCCLVALVGPEASVMRAVAMSAVVLAALALGRSTQAVSALSTATIAIVALDPWTATGYGFYLSASATLGIIVVGGPLADHLATRMPPLLAEALAIPLAAQISCLPILALFTDNGSAWGVLANALVAPVVAPLTVAGLAAALAAPWAGGVASLLLVPASMCTWWIDAVATTLSRWPGSGISNAATFAACLAILAAMLAVKRPLAALTALALLAALIWRQARSAGVDIPDGWQIVQCDVGQGAGVLVRAHGLTIMVDAGPPGEAASQCVRAAGVGSIDLLVLTHAHSDHIGGVPGVLDAADVGEVWVSPNMDPRVNGAWLDKHLTRRGITAKTVAEGEERRGRDGATAVRVLWPRGDAPPGDAEANAQSIAVRVEIPGGLLVMGDQPASSQSRFASAVEPARVMVVAHHGSADQSARLARNARPSIALVSVGENSYGHPSARMLQMYAPADLYTTRACGTIVVRGSEVTSRCERPVG